MLVAVPHDAVDAALAALRRVPVAASAADIGKVAQRLPGESLRFDRVERDEALDALRSERLALSIR